jgi:hypothetical protein
VESSDCRDRHSWGIEDVDYRAARRLDKAMVPAVAQYNPRWARLTWLLLLVPLDRWLAPQGPGPTPVATQSEHRVKLQAPRGVSGRARRPAPALAPLQLAAPAAETRSHPCASELLTQHRRPAGRAQPPPRE